MRNFLSDITFFPLQIFRGLRVPITSRMLTDILSRLVETAAEQGEDMQGYVTELVLTLEASVESLETDLLLIDHICNFVLKYNSRLWKRDCAGRQVVDSRSVVLGCCLLAGIRLRTRIPFGLAIVGTGSTSTTARPSRLP